MKVLEQIRGEFSKWWTLPSLDAIDVVAGTVIANRLPGSAPLYLMLVGPSGSGKSEYIEALTGLDGVFPLSKVTPATFVSGYKDREGGLLAKLTEDRTWILAFKDFTTVISERKEDRAKILSHLREIYDGTFSGWYGTGKRPQWKGKIGVIAACTGVFDSVNKELGNLGERFIIYRPVSPNPTVLAEKAMRGAKNDYQMKQDFKRAMKLLDDIPLRDIDLSFEVRKTLSKLCTFLAQARTQVPRNRFTREIIELPEPELTGRLAKQLSQLLRGITIAREMKEPQMEEVDLIFQVAFSSIPSFRYKVMQAFPSEGTSVRELAYRLDLSKTLIGREVEDLGCIGIFQKAGQEREKWMWSPRWDDWRQIVQTTDVNLESE